MSIGTNELSRLLGEPFIAVWIFLIPFSNLAPLLFETRGEQMLPHEVTLLVQHESVHMPEGHSWLKCTLHELQVAARYPSHCRRRLFSRVGHAVAAAEHRTHASNLVEAMGHLLEHIYHCNKLIGLEVVEIV